jgi:hypothetical protein
MSKRMQELKLGDVYMDPKRIFKKMQISKLGDAQGILLFINQHEVVSFKLNITHPHVSIVYSCFYYLWFYPI